MILAKCVVACLAAVVVVGVWAIILQGIMVPAWWLVAFFILGGWAGIMMTLTRVSADLVKEDKAGDEATEYDRPEVTD